MTMTAREALTKAADIASEEQRECSLERDAAHCVHIRDVIRDLRDSLPEDQPASAPSQTQGDACEYWGAERADEEHAYLTKHLIEREAETEVAALRHASAPSQVPAQQDASHKESLQREAAFMRRAQAAEAELAKVRAEQMIPDRPAVESAVKVLIQRFEKAPCDSDGASQCVRCNVMFLARVMRDMLDASQPPAEREEKQA